MVSRYFKKSCDSTKRECPLCGNTFNAENGIMHFLKPDKGDPLAICSSCTSINDVKEISFRLWSYAIDVALRTEHYKLFQASEYALGSFKNGELVVLDEGGI